MKRTLTIIFMMVFCTCLHAQDKDLLPKGLSYSNEYLDTLNIKQKLSINDYSMVGIQYGVGLSQVSWNPPQKQDMVFIPVNIGITYTKYGKMFGYIPYFGFQIGLLYTQEGYQFEYNEEKDYTYKIQGAEKAIYDIAELPMFFQLHYDLWNFKIMAQVGCYAGYRLAIERFPGKTGSVAEEVRHSFLDTDRRWDYGIKGGIGFGLVFDPIEIHFNAMYKYSMGTLYDPDHNSPIYYRFAYPTNIIVSAGVNYQLSKRTGKTKAELKRQAKEMVFEK